jgi:acylphosphatase
MRIVTHAGKGSIAALRLRSYLGVPMPAHYSIRVTGRVQGVFYRASARAEAERLGLDGFVRNEPDGSVYAEAEGEKETLERFVEWCRRGPPQAEVGAVEIAIGTPRGYQGFRIR